MKVAGRLASSVLRLACFVFRFLLAVFLFLLEVAGRFCRASKVVVYLVLASDIGVAMVLKFGEVN
jgi:hypothetical protein